MVSAKADIKIYTTIPAFTVGNMRKKMTTIICSYCSSKNNENLTHCAACGAPLSQSRSGKSSSFFKLTAPAIFPAVTNSHGKHLVFPGDYENEELLFEGERQGYYFRHNGIFLKHVWGTSDQRNYMGIGLNLKDFNILGEPVRYGEAIELPKNSKQGTTIIPPGTYNTLLTEKQGSGNVKRILFSPQGDWLVVERFPINTKNNVSISQPKETSRDQVQKESSILFFILAMSCVSLMSILIEAAYNTSATASYILGGGLITILFWGLKNAKDFWGRLSLITGILLVGFILFSVFNL